MLRRCVQVCNTASVKRDMADSNCTSVNTGLPAHRTVRQSSMHTSTLAAKLAQFS